MSGARVAVGTVELHLPDVGSLKGKRHALKGLKDTLRRRFARRYCDPFPRSPFP